ncbi:MULTISPECIES: hypothetical protein [Mammaliicoccus]|uniref:DUF2283 domain-containing protein n=1 Tax=Mammaliicoccus sciuri TaxID=1296 RepID=A0AB37HRI2_MAMSC|nr:MULTISPECIES: hypothetical protein [Mammaliicoccus]PTJ70073.1 hypothetical protein BU008_10655 [Mammaliicoccus sciuri]QRN90284.1 hypothetical protein JRU67_09445 [Mammaliicoccus sciuri]
MSNEKAIYYFYDDLGNRRLIEIEDIEDVNMSISENIINRQIQHMPRLKNNYYVQIDTVEFKLD